MTFVRQRKALRRSAWLATVVAVAATGWMVFGADTAETAPALRPEPVLSAAPGVAGGIQADVRGFAKATLYATRAPDGSVSVECSDPATAAAMVLDARP